MATITEEFQEYVSRTKIDVLDIIRWLDILTSRLNSDVEQWRRKKIQGLVRNSIQNNRMKLDGIQILGIMDKYDSSFNTDNVPNMPLPSIYSAMRDVLDEYDNVIYSEKTLNDDELRNCILCVYLGSKGKIKLGIDVSAFVSSNNEDEDDEEDGEQSVSQIIEGEKIVTVTTSSTTPGCCDADEQNDGGTSRWIWNESCIIL